MSEAHPPGYPVPSVPDDELPSHIETAAERERWELAVGISQEIARQRELDSEQNSPFVLFMARQIYFSDIQTGTPGDPAVPIEALFSHLGG